MSAERASAYRTAAQRGITRVEDLWGHGSVPTPVHLDLPANAAAWALATRRDDDRQTYSASTVWEGPQGRIVVHPATWGAVSPEGRQAVVTHEITHLAMGPNRQVPWWVSEGLAEFTALRKSELSLAAIVGSAWWSLTSSPPSQWPQPSNSADPWMDYAPAWLACVYLARTYGETPLLDLHTALAGGAALDAAMTSVFGQGESRVQRDWSRWLTRQRPASSSDPG